MPDLKKLLTLEALSEALPSWLKRSTKPEYNADEIDSTLTTNQFVTASDIDNWNAKGTYSKPSGGIPKSDLSSIVQTSLEKADSALQNETDPTVPSWAKQTNKPSYTQDEVADGSTYKRVTQNEKDAWSGKQNALTTVQMSAVNSGATQDKINQIQYNTNNCVKNLCNYVNPSRYINCTIVDGEFKQIATDSKTNLMLMLQGVRSDGTAYAIYPGESITTTGLYSHSFTFPGDVVKLRIGHNGTTMDAKFEFDSDKFVVGKTYILSVNILNCVQSSGVYRMNQMMICEASIYAIDPSFKPYALPNSDLTNLEVEDRAALAEEIDAGAKNKWDFANPDSTRSTDITKNSNGSFTISCTNASWTQYFKTFTVDIGKSYALSFNVDSMTNASSFIVIGRANNSSGTEYFSFTPSLGENRRAFTATTSTIWIAVYINNSETARSATATIEPMICTKAAFAMSQKFVPHRMSYQDLSDKKLDRLRSASDGGLISSGDLNSITVNSFALYTNEVSNLPETAAGSGYCFVRTSIFDSNAALQEAIMLQTGRMYTRTKYSNTWGEWKKATNS